MTIKTLVTIITIIAAISALSPAFGELTDGVGALEVEAVTTDAMSAYKQLLENQESGYNDDGEWSYNAESFALYDINNDGTPELFTQGGGRMDYSKIFTFKSGRTQYVWWTSEFILYSNGLIQSNFSGSGYWLRSYYTVDKNATLQLAYRFAEWNDESYSQGKNADSDAAPKVSYSVINKKVQELANGAAELNLSFYKNTRNNRAKYLKDASSDPTKPMTAYRQVVKSGKYAYCDAWGIWKVNLKNKKKKILKDVSYHYYKSSRNYFDQSIMLMSKDGKYIYYLYYQDKSGNAIINLCRVNISNGKSKTLAKKVDAFAIEEGKIYYRKYGYMESYNDTYGWTYHVMNLNGSDKESYDGDVVMDKKNTNAAGYNVTTSGNAAYTKFWLKKPNGKKIFIRKL